jgi:hypothetical protein
MAEWDDVEIDESSEEEPSVQEKLTSLWPVWAGVAVLAFALGFYWFFRGGPSEEVPTAPQAEDMSPEPEVVETPPLEPEPEESIELPVLDESDELVRNLIGALSSNAEWAEWLANEELIRTFVAVVHNIAEGVSPKRHLPFLAPTKPFEATYNSGAFYVDPKSYDRYNLVAEVVSSVNARGAAEFYRKLKPLIDQANEEMGYPDRDFDETLARALDQLLKTPTPDGFIELSGETVSYRYVDRQLERLNSAQKQFLRMGPKNVRRIKEKLTELKAALRLG